MSSHLLLSSGMLILWQTYLNSFPHKDWFIPPIHCYGSDSLIPPIPPNPFSNSSSSIKSALLQYCPAANAKCFKYYKTAKKFSAYSSKNEQKKKMYQIFPNSKSHKEQSLPPNPPPCTNIYIFNTNKNVKRNVRCAKARFSKAYPFCAAVTCIPPKSSSSSSVRFRLPVAQHKCKTCSLMYYDLYFIHYKCTKYRSYS